MLATTLKTLALGLISAATLAGSAQAAIVSTSDVKLTSVGYDFGGDGWAAGAPTGNGELHFHFENGEVRPHLLGTLHLNDADGTCARMRLRYLDPWAGVLHTSYGGTVCVTDDHHHEWSVDLDPYADASIYRVEVALLKQTATGEFVAASSDDIVRTSRDDVKITEDGVDFGDSGWSLGAPTDDGDIYWGLTGGVVTPILTGAIHLNNSSGVCARMNLRYLTEGGTFLTARAGGTVCAGDNGHHSWSVDLSPYSSDRIGQVKVQLQTLAANGSWLVAGSQTESIAQ
jgi:hypothetical protein